MNQFALFRTIVRSSSVLGRLFLFRLDGNEIRLPRLSYKLQVAGINDYNGSYREIGLPRSLRLSSFTTRGISRFAILDT